MAQLSVTFPKSLVPVAKHRGENRGQHKSSTIVLCCQWSWRMKNDFSLIGNDAEIQPSSALFQPFSLANISPSMWFAC